MNGDTVYSAQQRLGGFQLGPLRLTPGTTYRVLVDVSRDRIVKRAIEECLIGITPRIVVPPVDTTGGPGDTTINPPPPIDTAIYTLPLPPTTLTAAQCGAYNIPRKGNLVAAPVVGAQTYRFIIKDAYGNLIASQLSNTNTLNTTPYNLTWHSVYFVRIDVAAWGVTTVGVDTCFILTEDQQLRKVGTSTITTTAAFTQIAAYPNPFSNDINITLPVEAEVTVSDLQGRIFESRRQAAGSVNLGESLAPGTYLVRVRTANETQTIRIVKAGN